jgi:hypothetical protein
MAAARVVPHPAIVAVDETRSIEHDLLRLEAELKRLEAEYNMFFSGRLAKPPWETRSRVEGLIKQYDRAQIRNLGDRFRFSTLQARFSALVDLWDRGLRAREEGRAGPFSVKHVDRPTGAERPKDRILRVTTFHDPSHEMESLQDLYESLVEARHELGEEAVPFYKFANLVKTQVSKLRRTGSTEVAFRVALKDGKVSFTARALKGVKE